MRHGEGYHNVLASEEVALGNTTKPPYHSSNLAKYPDMIDAPLTDVGRREAWDQRNTTKDFATNGVEPGLLVVSPLRRATDTGLLALGHLFPKKDGSLVNLEDEGFSGIVPTIPVVAHDGCRESYSQNNLCDRRRPISTIQLEYPFISYPMPKNCDPREASDYEPEFSEGFEGLAHLGIDGETADTLVDRCYDFMVSLTQEMMPEHGVKCCAVATHSVFLFGLTLGVLRFEGGEERKGLFGTGEMRSFRVRVEKNKN